METPNWYLSLTEEECERVREQLDERYWNAVEQLGAITTERAMLLSRMQEFRDETAR